jgi:hypothetical protein
MIPITDADELIKATLNLLHSGEFESLTVSQNRVDISLSYFIC